MSGKSSTADNDDRQFVQLDTVDRQIIAALQEDGRATNRSLAEKIGVAEATIAARIKDLYDNSVMRVVGMMSLEASASPIAVTVGVRVLGRSIEDIAHDLADLDEAQSVMSVLGRFDLYVGLAVNDLKHLRTVLENRIGAIPGVESLECFPVLENIKHSRQWAKL